MDGECVIFHENLKMCLCLYNLSHKMDTVDQLVCAVSQVQADIKSEFLFFLLYMLEILLLFFKSFS